MKQKLQLLVFLLSFGCFAQAPAGYYNTATGTGYTLKTQLYNIIKGHTDRGYAGLWTTYQTSDRDNQNENDNTIFDLYSENQSGADPYNYAYSTGQCGTYAVEGDCYNREHMIPQSVFNSSAPMVSDAHFIPPTDGKVNGMRADYPHGNVATASWTSQNGSKLGTSAVSGYTGTVFEPNAAFKGDIARMYFYFATRYENTVAGYSFNMFNGTSNQVFTTAFRDMLLAWHAADPVSSREIARNNAIYARQGNRNPYIDNPSYVNMIWGGAAPDTTAPSVPAGLVASNITQTGCTLSWSSSTDNVAVTGYNVYQGTTLKTTVTSTSASITGLTAGTAYSFSVKAKDAAGNLSASSTSVNVTTTAPADTTPPTTPSALVASNVTQTGCTLSWTASSDNTGVTGYDVYQGATLKTTVASTSAAITGLTAATLYSFSVRAKDAAGNISASSTAINVTTTSASPSITELYFSEYLEGSSNNKALEIANATGASINLSIYSVKKQTNGAGTWSTGLALSGTLVNNAKFVIVNSAIASACYSTATANISTAAGEMTFNGNDAVGLFKNGVLIDVIGIFNGGTANFSADETLRRKTTAIVPATTFNKTNDWDVLAIDTCSGLGSRMASPTQLTATTISSTDFNIYPNPTNGDFNIYFNNMEKEYAIEIYTILGKKVFEKSGVTTTNNKVSQLQTGVYLVKITRDSDTVVKKVIIN
ncbi:T9SS type A sorting domain-containing protein [Flavobacterium amnicola]|uniref:T9SS type A sorting domain-containing protein n=1 Tax=Flavobacterium amnicola TaxID=2506422 RepID=A0A4Q1K2V8_9FLAO|nr:endonuclease [Flavobacterium amnicola]RXR19069.1 T9SS type A sorting domain-containing protein [Flavobacterium amnicola]